jgi:hypothetical protein
VRRRRIFGRAVDENPAQWYVETPGQTSTATQWVSAAHQAVQPYSVDPNRVMFSGLNF